MKFRPDHDCVTLVDFDGGYKDALYLVAAILGAKKRK